MLRSTRKILGAVAVTLALLIAGGASAESVRLNTDARLRARPGERAPTITKLDEGQVVRVVGRQGRWLKVSVGGRSGWVTRTQVDAEEQAVAARDVPTRARKATAGKARKGWSSLDEDATGDEAVEDDEEEMDESLEEEKPAAKPKKKAAPVKKVAKAKRGKKGKGDWKVGMMVVVRSDAAVRQRPSAKADELYTAERGEEMKVILLAEDGGKWVRVQDGEGTRGWIEARAIASADDWSGDEEEEEDDDSAIASDDSDDEELEEDDDDRDDRRATRVRRRAKKGGLWYSVGANVAFVSKKQDFASDSMSLVGQYALANNSPAVLVGGFVGKQFGKYDLAAEAWYMRTVGGSGIDIEDPNAAMGAMPENLSWTEQTIDIRATGGYHMDKYTLIGRGGYHINNTVVTASDVAKLPSETLKGFTVGVGIEAPKLSDKIGVRVSVDMLLSGTLEQTENLKDGESAEVAGYYVHALATYRVNPKLEGLATYNLAYEGFAFTGASQREAAAVNGKRIDLQHVVGVGIRYQF